MKYYSIMKETLYSQLTIRSYITVLQTGQNSKQSTLKLHCSLLLHELKKLNLYKLFSVRFNVVLLYRPNITAMTHNFHEEFILLC
jgi:hypothetical protein